jgi:hypothetical protein
MLYFVWWDIYSSSFSVQPWVSVLLMVLMGLKFCFDLAVVVVFVLLVRFFSR